jgi:hypothetical protein
MTADQFANKPIANGVSRAADEPSGPTTGIIHRKHGDMRDYMAPSLFQPSLARQAIRDAHEKRIPILAGYYAGLASVPITRWLAPMGFDFNWIDWEHSAMDIETMTTVSFCYSFAVGCPG